MSASLSPDEGQRSEAPEQLPSEQTAVKEPAAKLNGHHVLEEVL
jgi:hypothetical protein